VHHQVQTCEQGLHEDLAHVGGEHVHEDEALLIVLAPLF